MKFYKLLFSLSHMFVLFLHHLFLKVCDYLTEIVHHGWLGSQLQISDICEARGSFFEIPIAEM